jgi:triphosphoribosyl-dephospho-CoA synthase
MLDFSKPLIIPSEAEINILKESYLFACKKDVEVIKPGNVSIKSAHPDTTAEDYITSSINSSNALFLKEYSLGERISYAINLTKKETSVNTNLGIILLCAPIIHAFIHFRHQPLKDSIHHLILHSAEKDTMLICEAIQKVNPGGLGSSNKMDVKLKPYVNLYEIMSYASKYDRISYQYTNKFSDILNFILPKIDEYQKTGETLDFSLPLIFLEILAKIPDSHITRKFGEKIAKKTSNQAYDLLKILKRDSSRENAMKCIADLDYDYKKNGINPGTTADLLIASLMVYMIFSSVDSHLDS